MSFQGFAFPSEKLYWLVEYLFLALDCSIPVVAAFYFNYQFAFQGNIVQAILSFSTDTDNPAKRLEISLRHHRRGLTLAIAEAAIKLVATRRRNYFPGVFHGNVAFNDVETRPTRVGILTASRHSAGLLEDIVDEMNTGTRTAYILARKTAARRALTGLALQDIWIVDDYYEGVPVMAMPRPGEKVILCHHDKEQESELVIVPFYN
jgi:hypothetical protein